MKVKERRLTADLNLAISKASAAVSMLGACDSAEQRRAMLEQATKALDDAHAIMVKISRAAETI